MVHLCKDLGIRHPEELSFCKQLEQQHLKKNYSSFPKAKFQANEYEYGRDYISPAADTNSFIPTHSTLLTSSNGSLDSPNGPFSCAPYQHNTYQKPRHTNPIGSPTGVSKFHNTYSHVFADITCSFFKINTTFISRFQFIVCVYNKNEQRKFHETFLFELSNFGGFILIFRSFVLSYFNI